MRTRERLRHIKPDFPLEKNWLDRVLEIAVKKGTPEFLQLVRDYRQKCIDEADKKI